jgi:hypothetical protein
MYRAILLFFPLALLCTAPPPLSMEPLPNVFSAIASMDSLCSFKAFGDMKLSQHRERLTGKIDVLWNSDSNFSINFYSPWGGRVASIATADSTHELSIRAGDSVVKKRMDDKIALDGIIDYPLTFQDFIRIATGRILLSRIDRVPNDSLVLKGNKAVLIWREDSMKGRPFTVSAVVDRKHLAITDVIYRQSNSPRWQLSISSIKDGAPEEFHFEDQYNNYFYLNYETVIVRRGDRCRRERL